MDDVANENELDKLLDEESDEEFGAPRLVGRISDGLDNTQHVAQWSAEDFSRIYVEFRPHLLRHANRYLFDALQAEEVVQDAFLYLMTSLPELDSEEGVLKFLKWKVRNLSYDVLRSAPSRRESLSGSFEDQQGYLDDVSSELERAEDQAVISLALAKLNPRHREAIVASVYEEKSNEELARQLALSDNAARQLLFRAKRAFRHALVGEAELQGSSVAEVLSVATKKAAGEIRRHGVTLSAFVLGSGLLVGMSSFQFQDAPEGVEMAIGSVESSIDSSTNSSVDGLGGDTFAGRKEAIEVENETGLAAESKPQLTEAKDRSITGQNQNDIEPYAIAQIGAVEEIDKQDSASLSAFGELEDGFSKVLTTNVSNAGIYNNSYAAGFTELFQGESIEVFGGTGVSSFIDLDSTNLTVGIVLYQMNIGGQVFLAAAEQTEVEYIEGSDGLTIQIRAAEFYLVDQSSRVFSESPMSEATATVVLELGEDGKPNSAQMFIEG